MIYFSLYYRPIPFKEKKKNIPYLLDTRTDCDCFLQSKFTRTDMAVRSVKHIVVTTYERLINLLQFLKVFKYIFIFFV